MLFGFNCLLPIRNGIVWMESQIMYTIGTIVTVIQYFDLKSIYDFWFIIPFNRELKCVIKK